jgi:hypothetical protein
MNTNPQISPDLELMLAGNTDGFLQIDGFNGAKYWLLSEAAMDVRMQVLEGLAEANLGQSETWNAEEIKALGREQLRNGNNR